MFDRMTLGARLAAGFGVLLTLLALVTGTAAWEMRSLAAEARAYGANIVPSLKEQYVTAQALAQLRRLELRHLLSDDQADMDGIEADMAAARKRLAAAMDRYARELLANDEDRRDFDRARSAIDAYHAYWAALRPLSRQTADDPAKLGEAKATMAQGLKVFLAAQSALDDWWQFNMKLSDEAAARADQAYGSAKAAMFGLAVAALVLGLAAAWLITRSVQRQIGGEPAYAMAVVGEIAEGNLSVDVQLRDGDDRSLLAAVRAMRDRLREIVTQVRTSSDNIATGSTQIASGNADLSQRTEEQASNLQQTAASMEQLSDAVQNSAATAGQARQLAAAAAAAATRGGEAVGQVVASMGDISTASHRIGEIIGTIDGIAFQTNILALNAAVEAARAGEQGRGFAVVAGEVRTLARRSAEAAREIKSLIGANADRVELGARQVDDAGQAMTEIVDQVRRVSQMITELSDSAAAQSTGIIQVGHAVSQLDQVTQQNAALVEESAAAAESLRQQADRLRQVVGVFRLARGDVSGGQAPAVALRSKAPTAALQRGAAVAAVASGEGAARADAARAPALSEAGSDDWTDF